MYKATALLFLAASSVSATVLAQRATPFGIAVRDSVQGWSLQSATCPSDSTSCGNGACCPTGLTCNKAANHEVAACCSSASDCRGDVEGSPKCANSAWNLWVGYDGNGFCCEVGKVGAYDTSKSVAGVCVDSVGSLRSAQLTSTGSGSAATTAASSSTSAAATTTGSASTKATTTGASTSASESATKSAAATTATTAVSSSGTNSNASGTGSPSTSSTSTPTSTPNSGSNVGAGFGLMGAMLLAVAAL